MVYGPRGAPGWPVSTPWFVKFFFAVIVAITTTLAPIGWPNIDNVTCLLTPSVALPGSQYQEFGKPNRMFAWFVIDFLSMLILFDTFIDHRSLLAPMPFKNVSLSGVPRVIL